MTGAASEDEAGDQRRVRVTEVRDGAARDLRAAAAIVRKAVADGSAPANLRELIDWLEKVAGRTAASEKPSDSGDRAADAQD